MPPKKRYANSLKIGFSDLELLLLDVLRRTMGGAYGDHVRLAVRYYAKHNPNLSAVMAEEYFKAHASKLDAEGKKALRAEIEAFFAGDVTIPRSKWEDSSGLRLPFDGDFDSDELDVNED